MEHVVTFCSQNILIVKIIIDTVMFCCLQGVDFLGHREENLNLEAPDYDKHFRALFRLCVLNM